MTFQRTEKTEYDLENKDAILGYWEILERGHQKGRKEEKEEEVETHEKYPRLFYNFTKGSNTFTGGPGTSQLIEISCQGIMYFVFCFVLFKPWIYFSEATEKQAL